MYEKKRKDGEGDTEMTMDEVEKYSGVGGELVHFKWNKLFEEWRATFTETELRAFVKRIKNRTKRKAAKK